jgi:hypothetical protein
MQSACHICASDGLKEARGEPMAPLQLDCLPLERNYPGIAASQHVVEPQCFAASHVAREIIGIAAAVDSALQTI